MTRESKRTLALLALVCTLPVVASYLAFYVWPPADTVNYGELIEPSPLPAAVAAAAPELEGRWALVFASRGRCDEDCERTLYYMRQVRTAQGEHMDRVERLWLRADADPAPVDFLEAHPDLVVRAVSAEAIAALPAEAQVLVVDPLGNLMMRYPSDPDPKRMIRDLGRLLKYSRLG